MQRSRGELGVARRGEFALEVLDDVERQAAEQRDGQHFPHKHPRGDEGQVWKNQPHVKTSASK